MKTDWAYIDKQMQQYSPFLRDDLLISPIDSNSIATKISNEIHALEVKTVQELLKIDSVGIQNRIDELRAFQMWMDSVNFSIPKPDPAIVRAQVIAQNYICFIYLGESIFKELRKLMPNNSVTKKCCKFLTNNPIRAFRNSLAHANWKYKQDFSGIIFWAKKGEQQDELITQWEVNQFQLAFWQALARCTGYIVFTELQNRMFI